MDDLEDALTDIYFEVGNWLVLETGIPVWAASLWPVVLLAPLLCLLLWVADRYLFGAGGSGSSSSS